MRDTGCLTVLRPEVAIGESISEFWLLFCGSNREVSVKEADGILQSMAGQVVLAFPNTGVQSTRV